MKYPYLREFFTLWPVHSRNDLAYYIMILGVSVALDIDSKTSSDKLYATIKKQSSKFYYILKILLNNFSEKKIISKLKKR
jgi:hypothetical protein